MDNFNYEGVTEAINSFDLLRSTPRQIAKKAVAAFLADNELWVRTGNTVTDTVPLPIHKTAPEHLTLSLPEYVRAGGSDE